MPPLQGGRNPTNPYHPTLKKLSIKKEPRGRLLPQEWLTGYAADETGASSTLTLVLRFSEGEANAQILCYLSKGAEISLPIVNTMLICIESCILCTPSWLELLFQSQISDPLADAVAVSVDVFRSGNSKSELLGSCMYKKDQLMVQQYWRKIHVGAGALHAFFHLLFRWGRAATAQGVCPFSKVRTWARSATRSGPGMGLWNPGRYFFFGREQMRRAISGKESGSGAWGKFTSEYGLKLQFLSNICSSYRSSIPASIPDSTFTTHSPYLTLSARLWRLGGAQVTYGEIAVFLLVRWWRFIFISIWAHQRRSPHP